MFTTSAFCAARYRVVDLGELYPDFGSFSAAYAINDFGQIVGFSTTGFDQFYWDAEAFLYDSGVYPKEPMKKLGLLAGYDSSQALAINNAGQIVGVCPRRQIIYSEGVAFVYDNNKMTGLGTFGQSSSSANGINDYGQIVGSASGFPFQYNLYERETVPFPPALTDSGAIPYAINKAGEIVGASAIDQGNGTLCKYAFIYGRGEGISGINDVLCPTLTVARGINNQGATSAGHVIVNEVPSPFSFENAFLWEDGLVTYLSTLGGPSSSAYAINTNDQIVGSSSTDPGGLINRAFVWANDQMEDLNGLINPASGWTLFTARGINGHGQIVGEGYGPNGSRAFLLNPILHGIDISIYSHHDDPEKSDITEEEFRMFPSHGLSFVIVQGWGGKSINTRAYTQSSRARSAGLLTAGFCYLNFTDTYGDGGRQIKEALTAFGSEARYLGFMAIDVENEFVPSGLSHAAAIARIEQAVAAVNNAGLRPIIYTKRSDYWDPITGNTTVFSDRGIALWHTQNDRIDDLDRGAGLPVGGWQQRAGKQYEVDDSKHGNPVTLDWLPGVPVDKDLFDLGAFTLRNPNYRAVPRCARVVGIGWSGGQLVLEWDDPEATLQQSPSCTEPSWTDVPDATSPYFVPATGIQQFYRLSVPPDPLPETWTTTRAMTSARGLDINNAATMLPDGKVLVVGGDDPNTSEVYDPISRTWTNTSATVTNHFYGTSTLLLNGKVLITGGAGDGSDPALTSAEIFDPDTGTWEATGSMTTNREFHTATLLPDGKVLVAGGDDGRGNTLFSAELYDPATEAWSATGSLTNARTQHTATSLPNGKVLVCGGYNNANGQLASAEIYDPATETWRSTGALGTPRVGHRALLMANGKVLVVAGNVGGATAAELNRTAEIYDAGSRMWTNTAAMTTNRIDFTATLLPDGKVLVAGGYYFDDGDYFSLASTELYDPIGGSWTATGLLNTARSSHAATVLPNGKVLVVGGVKLGTGLLSSAEVY